MNNEKLVRDWKDLVTKTKRTEEIEYSELFNIFKATHRAFCEAKNSEFVSRELCQMIMLLDEFTYFAAIMDENYLGDISSRLYHLNYALKNELFNGNYQSEFYLGTNPSERKEYFLNIENITLEQFVKFLNDEIDEDYNDVIL